MIPYEIGLIFGWIFFLLCSTLGFLGIVDIVIRHGFVPVCKSIWRNVLRAANGDTKAKRVRRRELDTVSES